MNVLWIKDNNAGHEKQTKILLDELSKTNEIAIQDINIKGFHPFFTYVDPVEENFYNLIISLSGMKHKLRCIPDILFVMRLYQTFL